MAAIVDLLREIRLQWNLAHELAMCVESGDPRAFQTAVSRHSGKRQDIRRSLTRGQSQAANGIHAPQMA